MNLIEKKESEIFDDVTPSPIVLEKASHYSYIDALRGIAFLGVLLVHCIDYLTYKNHLYPNLSASLNGILGNGRMGVQLFFLISGLTLVLSSRSRFGHEQHPITNFYVRRAFRIIPLFWLAIIVYTCIGGVPFARQHWAPFGFNWKLVIATAMFVHGWFPSAINSVVPGGWSVAVEMTFYLLFPMIFTWLTSFRRALVATCVAVASSIIIDHFVIKVYEPFWPTPYLYLYYGFIGMWFPTQMPVFFLGFVLSFLIQSKTGTSLISTMPFRKLKSLSCLCLAGLIIVLATYRQPIPYFSNVFEFGVAFLFLTWGLSLTPWKLLVNKVSCYVGLISYSCYLTHFIIVYVVLPPIFLWLNKELHLHLTTLVALSLYFILALPLVLVLSTLTYRFIELPGIALGCRLVKHREKVSTF